MKTENKNSTKHTKYWFQDLQEILDVDKMNHFLPSSGMSYSEKVNAIVRLTWYIGILGGIINANFLYLYIPVITMIVTYVLYLFRQETLKKQLKVEKERRALINKKNGVVDASNELGELDDELLEKFEDYLERKQCTQPNPHNPFGNPMPFDDRRRKPACNTLRNPLMKQRVEVAFDDGVLRDVNDIFDKNNAKRQFNTLPATTYPHDQTSFANWLYKRPPTCKEGNGAQCVANNFTHLNARMGTGGSYVVPVPSP